jgi:hypothetical protein
MIEILSELSALLFLLRIDVVGTGWRQYDASVHPDGQRDDVMIPGASDFRGPDIGMSVVDLKST